MIGVRAANRQRVVDLLRERGPMTQAALARAAGLSPATVSSIARELRADGWLEPAAGPRAALTLSRRAGAALGIDFGHSHVRVAVADLGHTVLAEAQEALDVDQDAADGVARAAAMARRLLAEAGVEAGLVTGVGVGVPAPLRRDRGEVGDSAILPGWIGARPGELIRDALGLEARVDNDANLGALAELVWGAGRGCSELVYVKAGSGRG